MKLDAARAQIHIFFVLLATNVSQQPTEQSRMQLLVAGGLRIHGPALLVHHRQQLRMNVPPLTPTAYVDEVLSQQVFMLAVGQTCGFAMASPGCFKPIPQAQIPAEFAFVIFEFGMRLVSLCLRLQRPVSHILHAQRRGNDQDFTQGLVLARGQDHASHARVQRQLGQRLANLGQRVVIVDRAEFIEQLKTICNGFRAWCL